MSVWTRIDNVLGINARNIDFVQRYNDRRHYPMADDKLLTKEMLAAAGIPHTRLLDVFRYFHELERLPAALAAHEECVMKPARGMAGGGVLILRREEDGRFTTPMGTVFTGRQLLDHGTKVLYGVYSIDNTTDALVVEERVHPHPFFTALSPKGVADIRTIVFDGEAVMAMSRIPTTASDGKANLALGAVGVGIELETGRITRAATKKGVVTHHPDTGRRLAGRTIPCWREALAVSESVQRHLPLRFLGVDLVVDERRGPIVLEVNVRPGLEIQNVNRQGLRFVLEKRLSRSRAGGGVRES